MTKYTPGPWIAFDNAGKQMQSYSQSSGVHTADFKQIICGCFSDIGGPEIAAANARLIAAAPDLLAALSACESLLAELQDGGAENPELFLARAAIAKATGEE